LQNEEPLKKRRKRIEVNPGPYTYEGKIRRVRPILGKNSDLKYPEIDEQLKKDLQTKDLKKDHDLRQRLLPALVKSYNQTLNKHPDNIKDYKFYTKKVVKALEPLLSAKYKNPYVGASLKAILNYIILFCVSESTI